MKLEVEKVENFPPLVRGSAARNSEEREQIKELLSQIGVNHRVKNVASVREYNSLQQRIRGVAKALNVRVTIQYAKDEAAVYFRAEDVDAAIEKDAARTSKASAKK
jgi:hypothetical protein